MYKVFYNDSVIILEDKSKTTIDNIALESVDNREELIQFLNCYFRKDIQADTRITGYNLSELVADFTIWFNYIEAAGGIVQNTEGKYMFIRRWDKWDFPKGKIEKKESPEYAAIREVEEETGIGNLKILNSLNNTNHIYKSKQKLYLKCTYWFLMATDDNSKPTPQFKEGIDEVVWFSKEQSKKVLSKSYRSLNETLMSVFCDD